MKLKHIVITISVIMILVSIFKINKIGFQPLWCFVFSIGLTNIIFGCSGYIVDFFSDNWNKKIF